MSRKLSISKAIGEALHEEMARDENVIIMGEDMGRMYSALRLVFRRSSVNTAYTIRRFRNPVSVAWRLVRRCAAYVR